MTIDARGLECPKPVVMAIKALPQLETGEVMDVIVDNDAAVENLKRMASGRGCAYSVAETDGEYHVLITKSGDAAEAPETEAPIDCPVTQPQERKPKVVVAIGTGTMGDGDDTLGALLMKSYIYALTQQEELPDVVLFFNGGAHLTCEGSESLEDIKGLAERGVEIFTCGTCLDFYQIKEKLSVGGVTNMYAIAEAMQTADRLVRI